jgi:dihydroorotate dehydrogenase electron transfer subunit
VKKKIIKAEILANKKAAPDHCVMDLKAPYLAAKAKPGQFINVRVRDTGTDPLLRIPLGIHRTLGGGKGVSLLYKVVGMGTEILAKREKGEELDILGPLGNGFDTSRLRKKDVALVAAGGHVIAPLYFLAGHLRAKGVKVVFFIGACEKKHVLLVRELEKLKAEVHVATEDGSRGTKGYDTAPLERYLKRYTMHDARRTIFACGPRPMIRALRDVSSKHRISAQVSIDEYMACGIGACRGCAVDTEEGVKLVCKDGPVFDINTLRF